MQQIATADKSRLRGEAQLNHTFLIDVRFVTEFGMCCPYLDQDS